MLVELRDWKTRFTQPGICLGSGRKYDLTFLGEELITAEVQIFLLVCRVLGNCLRVWSVQFCRLLRRGNKMMDKHECWTSDPLCWIHANRPLFAVNLIKVPLLREVTFYHT